MSHSTARPLGDSTNTHSTPAPVRNPSDKSVVNITPSNAIIDIFSPIPSVPSAAASPIPTVPSGISSTTSVSSKRQRVDSPHVVAPAVVYLTEDDDEPVEITSDTLPVVVDLTDLDDSPIPKTAGQLVYETPEIFRRVLDFASSRSLARMLCCEKRITAIVADVLYHEVTTARMSRMSRMSRKSERTAAYCDAVRVLDKNPLPEATTFKLRGEILGGRREARGLSSELTDSLGTWRTKFPNLQKIVYDHSASPLNASWVAHIRNGKLHVDLQTNFVITHTTPLPSLTSTKSIFGSTPQYDDVWKKYLYSNPDLDKRVVSINHSHAHNASEFSLSLDELIIFLTRRQSRRCAPMKALYLLGWELPGGITSEQLEQLCMALGPEARRLHISNKLLDGHADFSSAISIFNQHLPKLQHLEITYGPNCGDIPQVSFDEGPQLRGLPDLRFFSFCPKYYENEGPVDSPTHHLKVARRVYRLGTLECVFQNGNLRHVYQVKEFNEEALLSQDYARGVQGECKRSNQNSLAFDDRSLPLSGLPHLRFFSFDPIVDGDRYGLDVGITEYHHGAVAKTVYQLGAGNCTFQNGNFKHIYQIKEFNDATRKLWRDPGYRKTFTRVAEEHEKNHNGWNPGWRGRGGGW